MTIDPVVLLTILGMAVVTYATRIAGFVVLSRLNLTRRVSKWLHYVPGAVLVSIVAPSLVPLNLIRAGSSASVVLTTGLPDVIAAAVAVIVAVRTKNLLLTMAAGVVAVWILRHLIGG